MADFDQWGLAPRRVRRRVADLEAENARLCEENARLRSGKARLRLILEDEVARLRDLADMRGEQMCDQADALRAAREENARLREALLVAQSDIAEALGADTTVVNPIVREVVRQELDLRDPDHQEAVDRAPVDAVTMGLACRLAGRRGEVERLREENERLRAEWHQLAEFASAVRLRIMRANAEWAKAEAETAARLEATDSPSRDDAASVLDQSDPGCDTDAQCDPPCYCGETNIRNCPRHEHLLSRSEPERVNSACELGAPDGYDDWRFDDGGAQR